MDDIIKQRDECHSQLTSLQNEFQHIQHENKALKDEVLISYLILSLFLCFIKDKIQR
jgi:hypothetical protein